MNEKRKVECQGQYKAEDNEITRNLQVVWPVESNFTGLYITDYGTLEVDREENRYSWLEGYTTAILSGERIWQCLMLQPVPDYIRFYTLGGEMHYLPYEERIQLYDGPWNQEPEMFLPSRILDLAFLGIHDSSPVAIKNLSLLA